MKQKINDILFKIFWKTESQVENKELHLYLTPRFGKLGVIAWYVLTEKCKFEVVNEQE